MERLETDRNRQNKEKDKAAAREEPVVNKSLSSIEYAVNKFLGDFSTLKSEITQLKDTVLSSNSSGN